MVRARYLYILVTKLCPTVCNPIDCSTPGFPVLHYLVEFAQIHVHPLLLLLSIFPSIRVFSNELALPVMWLKYWIFSFSISPFNEYSGLISFRFDWFDLLEVHGTFKSLLQHHNSKASFFGTQPSLWSNSHICTCLLEKP